MESEQNPQSSFLSDILQRIILEVIGVGAFLCAWWLLWQARDPTSWLRLKLAEVGEIAEKKLEEHSAVVELREGIDYWEEHGTSE